MADGVGGCVFDNPGNGTFNWVGVFLIEGQLACRMAWPTLEAYRHWSVATDPHLCPPELEEAPGRLPVD